MNACLSFCGLVVLSLVYVFDLKRNFVICNNYKSVLCVICWPSDHAKSFLISKPIKFGLNLSDVLEFLFSFETRTYVGVTKIEAKQRKFLYLNC